MNKIRMIRIILMTIGAFSLISFSMCDDLQDLTGDIDNQYTPMLLSPPPGIFFDNGCSDRSDTIQWDFDWSDVSGATRYQICILHEGSQYLLVDTIVTASVFRYASSGAYITDPNRLNWTWMVRAGNEVEWWGWSETRDFSVEPLNADCPGVPCIPVLLSPAGDEPLDNNCQNLSDTIQWDFDWSDVTGATQYQIYVIHEGSQYPALDTTVSVSEYSYRMSDGYITDRNRTNWTWKVRAGNAGVWGEWSEIGYYDVEPLNTDCN